MAPIAINSAQNDKIFFAVVVNKGSYDDASQQTLFVTDDQHAAKVYVDYQNALHESMRSKIAASYAALAVWETLNPQPPYPRETDVPQKAIPSWNSLRLITDEMRAERKQLKAENEKGLKEARVPYLAWHNERKNVLVQHQELSLSQEEKVAHQNDNESHYELEPLAWMPPLERLLPADVLNSAKNSFTPA